MEANKKIVKILETTKGQLTLESVMENVKILLFHEILLPVVYPHPCDRPINLESVAYHIKNPMSLENTSLTPGLLEHELQTLVQVTKYNHGQVVVLDGSEYQGKTSDIFDKYITVRGYNYRLQVKSEQTPQLVLLSYEHILKQIEYQFKLGNGKYKPGFIGQLSLKQCLKESIYHNAYKAYIQFSNKTQCPVIINCLQIGEVATTTTLNIGSQGDSNANLQMLSYKFDTIESILYNSKGSEQIRVVLCNPPLQFNTVLSTNAFLQQTVCLSQTRIFQLLQNYSITIGFDLARYNRSDEALNFIAFLANLFPERIILTNGLKYKTDLTVFGGEGYQFQTLSPSASDTFGKFQRIINNDSVLSRIIIKNQLQLLMWKQKLQEVEIIVMWQCSKCGCSQSEKVQSFRKFGKQFCSIKCLKSFNF